MLKTAPLRLLLLTAMGLGCVFTSRPQLPIIDGATEFDATFDAPTVTDDVLAPPVDADRAPDVPAPFDASAPFSDAGASSDMTIESDQCRAPARGPDAGDADDAGFFNSRGEPCDPTTYDASVDGSDARDAGDAGDASDARELDAPEADR